MKYFGTDGIRGHYGGDIINPHFAYLLGIALGKYLQEKIELRRPSVLIGRDPRKSGESLIDGLVSGLTKIGIDSLDAGIVPTPSLAFGIRHLKMDMGIMLTASHNPHTDNGIKLFSAAGEKLKIEEEIGIEGLIDLMQESQINETNIQKVEITEAYLQNLSQYFEPEFLKGQRIVLDLANGATRETSVEAFRMFGAEVIAKNSGSGIINHGVGSEHPEEISKAFLGNNAIFGFAHDGDGDRIIACDQNGIILNGDKALGLLAYFAKKQGNLRQDSFVATIHSNSGLEKFLQSIGVKLHRSDVGDRNVKLMMDEVGSNWGGESSGHVLATDYLPTGDGLYTGLFLAQQILQSNQDIESLQRKIPLWPSQSGAFRVAKKIPINEITSLQQGLESCEKTLGDSGRILMRYSGTEPKIRLLVEAIDERKAKEIFNILANIIQKTL